MDRLQAIRSERALLEQLYESLHQSGSIVLNEQGHVVSVKLKVGDAVSVVDSNYLERLKTTAKAARPGARQGAMTVTDDLSDIFSKQLHEDVPEVKTVKAEVPEWLRNNMLQSKIFTGK